MFLNMLTFRGFPFCASRGGEASFIQINLDFTIKMRDETGIL